MMPNTKDEAALDLLADLAPQLSNAELRVMLEIFRQQMHGVPVKAESAEFVVTCGMARANVLRALDSLTARGFLLARNCQAKGVS